MLGVSSSDESPTVVCDEMSFDGANIPGPDRISGLRCFVVVDADGKRWAFAETGDRENAAYVASRSGYRVKVFRVLAASVLGNAIFQYFCIFLCWKSMYNWKVIACFPNYVVFPDAEKVSSLENKRRDQSDDRWCDMLSEAEIRKQFADGYDFPPLQIRLGKGDELLDRNDELDAILAVTAEDQTFDFAAEFKSRSTPRIFEEALSTIQKAAERRQMLPMLVVPFLRENQLVELQQRKLSGIDLSGNGVVAVPGKLLVYRTGSPNRYPDSAPTKYAYRGATSLVARAFLCQAKFQSLADIRNGISIRGGNVVLSTISKALKRLESDLIVDRTASGFRLRQADKLLEKLAESYTDPKTIKTATFAIKRGALTTRGEQPGAGDFTAAAALAPLFGEGQQQASLVLTGRSSIENYAVMGRQEWPVLYTTHIDRLIRTWGDGVEETSRFIDFELRETDDPTVYFDVRMTENLPYASPIQVFLECSAGDKREREAALQVKELILRELRG